MIVTVDDLKQYMSGVNLTDKQWGAAKTILAGIQGQLENYLNRPIEPVLVQERTQASWDGSLIFSITPVLQLISITDEMGFQLPIHGYGVNPQPVVPALAVDAYKNYPSTVSQIDRIPGTMYAYAPIDYGSIPFGNPGAWYAMKYIGGYIGDTSQMKLDILRAGAREMTRNHDDTHSLKDGSFGDDPNPTIQGLTGFGLTPEELRRHDRARRRVIV